MASKRQICECGVEFLALRDWTACRDCRKFKGSVVIDPYIEIPNCVDCGEQAAPAVKASNRKVYHWECVPADDSAAHDAIEAFRQAAAITARREEREYNRREMEEYLY